MASDEETIEVIPVTIDHWDLLTELFAGSPGVNECWCMWPLYPPRTHEPDHDRNRASMRSLLLSGASPGLLALAKGRAVGWCACGPRHRYPQYDHREGTSTFWAIACLYMEPITNREGIARRLIDSATEQAVRHAAAAIEGPPPLWLPGDAAAIAMATDTFLDNGFTQIGPGIRMPELRRVLA